MIRIYADFNACTDGGVDLQRLGTLRDLCAAKIRLRDGLHLTLYSDSSEDEDIEVDATARCGPHSRAPEGGTGLGNSNEKAFRDVPAASRDISVIEMAPVQRLRQEPRSGDLDVRIHGMDVGRALFRLRDPGQCAHCGARPGRRTRNWT